MSWEYTPKISHTPAQARIEASPARFKFVKAGRRFGKSKYACDWQIRKAIEIPGEDHWYVAPTYRMAHEIAWREYLDQIPRDLIVKKSERDLVIQLVNDSRISLKGSEEEDSLRGRRLGSLVMDEAAFQKANVYSRILRPMLADLTSPALFISSPRHGWFSIAHNYAATGQDKQSASFHFTIYDNPHISKDEIERIKATEPEHVWLQEYMAEEVDYQGQVYTEFNPKLSVFAGEKFSTHHKYPGVVGIDWGYYDDTGVAWLHFTPEGYVIVSKEHLKSGWDTARHSDVIRQGCRSRNIEGGAWVLDRSAFKKETKDRCSIADEFRDHLGVSLYRSEKSVDVGMDLMKRFLRGNGSVPWLYVQAGCKETIKALENWEWGQHEPDILAAIRYGLVHGVQKRMTALAESVPNIKFDADALDDKYISKLQVKKKGISSWGWDTDFGVPLGGHV